MTKRPGATFDNGFMLNIQMKSRIEKRIKKSCFGNNPIYPLLSTWISTWTEPEAL
jgi:hypothetical protein